MAVGKDFVVSSPFPDIAIPSDVDLWSFIIRNFHNYPQKTALIDATTRERMTFDEIKTLAETVAVNLLKHGYRTDRPLAVFMTNCLEYVVLCLAVWRLGGVVACINAMLLPGEVKFQLGVTKSEFVACTSENVETALKAIEGTSVQKLFCKAFHPTCFSWTSLTSPAVDFSSLPKRLNINQSKDTALILFSSGTTGPSKGVKLSHRSIIANCTLIGKDALDKLPKENGIIYQPLAHVYGIATVLADIYWGITAIIMPTFDLQKYIKLIEEYKVDNIQVVPPIMVMFASSKLLNEHNLTCVRKIVCGGAPLSDDVEKQVATIIGKQCEIRQAYGMTESCLTTCHHTTTPGEIAPNGLKYYAGSVGYPASSNLHKVVNINTGENLGPDQEGEICVKSDYLMLGYIDNPEATKAALDSDGWLHTGDIGYYNEDGCFFIVDRLKELIKYKAYQVAPAELEALLLSHEGIADAGVIGLPHAEAGEVPFAWVVIKAGFGLTEQRIHEFVNENAAPFKRLRGGIRFVDEIPKSASGKILRREIRRIEEENAAKANKAKL